MAGRHRATAELRLTRGEVAWARSVLAANRELQFARGWWDGYEGWRPRHPAGDEYLGGYLQGREASLAYPRTWGAETLPSGERLALRVA